MKIVSGEDEVVDQIIVCFEWNNYREVIMSNYKAVTGTLTSSTRPFSK